MKKKCLLIVLLLGLFTYLFFYLPLIVSPDGSTYFLYTKIFDGVAPFSTWNPVRGFSYPLILYISKHFFGNNGLGILISHYIFYLILIIFGYLLLNEIIKHYKLGKIKYFYILLFVIFIMFNPLIIGYSHTLLTEAVAPAIIMLSLYLVFKWRDTFINKSINIIYIILILL